MTWDRNAPYIAESKKIVWEVAPYLKGRGLDIGAGDFKVLPHVISVDNMNHQQFGFSVKPDVMVRTAENLDVFGSQSMDFVFSSHTLEHIENYQVALKEWWRLIKPNGYLVLYLPDEDEYPKVGEPGANPDHKWNVSYGGLLAAMDELRGWDLVDYQKRNENDEYSLLFVFKKTGARPNAQSFLNPRPAKTACVVRYGAYGDLMMATSVWAGLKKQGYHVTVFASPPGSDVITHDPNIDKLVLFDKDQVPNANLGDFWNYQAKKFDKFVNLSESVEGTFLAMPGRIQHGWSPMVRHSMMNRNYVEFAHDLAGVPHEPAVKFYPTLEEREWARKTRARMGKRVVMWSLAGSSGHKTWAGLDHVIASFMLTYDDVDVVLVGGPECAMLEAGWENEPRVHLTCGKWSIRQTLSFLEHCQLVIGPETGVLNAASCMDVPKVTLLSHSTHENLTRDWKNVVPVASKKTTCPGRGDNEAPACHQLHYGWANCRMDKESGVAQCQADISVQDVWDAIQQAVQWETEEAVA
jgi:ADP-heptose:LPS heptosyltransferase/predicted SAM-dependent methyltransferase